MPEYIYENPVYTVPQASIDTQIDPNSPSEFKRKAKGNLGDIWDQSAEASEKRTKQQGEDPVKKQFFKDYSTKRKGAKHPKDPSRFS